MGIVLLLLLLLLLLVVVLCLGGVWCAITQSLARHPYRVFTWQVVLLVTCAIWC
jgi:hypothetical protein